MRARKAAQTYDRIRSGKAREVRLAAGLTLADVAAEIDVTPQAVWLYENGRSLPRTPVALRYGRLLDALSREVGRT